MASEDRNSTDKPSESPTSSRRHFLTAAALTATTAAGCLGGGTNNAADGDAQPDYDQTTTATNDHQKPTTTTTPTTQEPPLFTKVGPDSDLEALIATINTDHNDFGDVSSFEYIDGGGNKKTTDITEMGGNVVSWKIRQQFSGRYLYVAGTQTFLAKDSDGNVIEEATLEFAPKLEIVDITPMEKAEKFPKHLETQYQRDMFYGDGKAGKGIVTIRNTGNGPVTLDQMTTTAFNDGAFGFTSSNPGSTKLIEPGNVMPGQTTRFATYPIDAHENSEITCEKQQFTGDVTLVSTMDQEFPGHSMTVTIKGSHKVTRAGTHYCDDVSISVKSTK